ncbi:glycosyltransferase family protein [Kribbella speibonae]|uniref:glycosyltransferase family protein n=1 Tax=Kribbella speibonae TaxID=1572660 RepID=UPI0013F4A517|nr:glycosyltransferase family protein [Kribbella speibonae]
MKILIGVCGIGQGHITRQSVIAELLLERGHTLSFLTYGPGVETLKARFPDSLVLPVYVPWVACGPDGLRFMETVRRSGWRAIPGILRDLSLIRRFRQSEPFDLCISDYEPVTARVAYATRTPLITLDQQSKLLGFETSPIGELSRKEERARLGLFFPKATKRIALSYFRVNAAPDHRFRVELRPPMVRSEIQNDDQETRPEHTLVYLSNYGSDSFVHLPDLVASLATMPNRRFTIFDSLGRRCEAPLNVVFEEIDREFFPKVLADSDSVISTAGFNLISECVAAEVPIMTIPLATYDQHLCSRTVETLRIGMGLKETRSPTPGELAAFVQQISNARHSMRTNPDVLKPSPTSTRKLIDEIEAVAKPFQDRG